MKSILSVLAVVGMVGMVNTAKASHGDLLLCASLDHEVLVRVAPQIGAVDVIKVEHNLPRYSFTGCTAGTGSVLLNCTGTGNRTFVLNQDLSAMYIGSHETRDLTCQHSGFSAN